ncbi:T9SS type A sorting domain-containing protein [Fulvivirga sp. M361]|uniref:chondroitinase-B domain-containing protein n=1 Tax=Fulvivirga sp. M361 TaxID=2594266 RepID=UPI00117B0BB8|nr:chondroitinase-B domain-containing protein [Fulvivirga sp. M361]TRX54873.1 T9SS type A sorting domain-containing protein [Fulvivirga sp. M361]
MHNIVKRTGLVICVVVLVLFVKLPLEAGIFPVSSQSEFNIALTSASENDTILWKSGTYQDIHLEIDESNLVIMAEVLGQTIFTGASRVTVNGSDITLKGFQFLNGDIGTNHVIRSRGSHNTFEQLNIKDYTSYKYLIIEEECRYNTVAYCNFENRINLDDQNILSILVDDTEPGYHVVQYCSFKNFDGSGNDLGIEPIRIGVSTQAEFISRSTVEYCYFTQCNGDGELISSKATQNVYRYNTFEDNPLAELVLRHGNQAVVYGNFFLNGMGGVRVREGREHVIFNNYFSGLTRRSLYLQNDADFPVGNITVAFNSFIGSEEIRLSESGDDKPTNITFANNIFTQPAENLFDDATGTETWLGNIYSGFLGITLPANGLTNNDPQMEINSEGYYGLSVNSPAIDAAVPGFPAFPEYDGLETDHTVALDLMQQSRPVDIAAKDLGCSESPHDVTIQPVATAENTGPVYLRNLENQAMLTINHEGNGVVTLDPPSGIYAKGTTVTVTAIPAEGYSFTGWSNDLSGTTNPETLVMNDNMEITVTFTLDQVTSLSAALENEIRWFPNPVADHLNITLKNEGSTWTSLDILDSSGMKMKTLINNSASQAKYNTRLDVSDLPAGMYMVRIAEENGQFSTRIKFIKK